MYVCVLGSKVTDDCLFILTPLCAKKNAFHVNYLSELCISSQTHAEILFEAYFLLL